MSICLKRISEDRKMFFVQCQCQYQPKIPLRPWRALVGQSSTWALREHLDMTSVDLEETLEYLKIQESLRFENLIKYYLCKEIFLCFSLP